MHAGFGGLVPRPECELAARRNTAEQGTQDSSAYGRVASCPGTRPSRTRNPDRRLCGDADLSPAPVAVQPHAGAANMLAAL
ncbi:hypothetical protein GCM10010272_26120 [Streptomyces lateritius]|nr:hypothetical protein GCM10010272_26120 [Streptomyces lateritius]